MSKRIEILTDPEIIKLQRGGYSVRFRIPPHHGLPESKSPRKKLRVKTIGAARKEAENYRRELEEQINDYRNIENITFGEYARQWHEQRLELEEIKITSWDVDELLIRQIEKSVLSHLDIREVDENDLDNFKMENKRLGFSNDRQDKLLKKAKQILKHAEKRRVIKHNPSGAVTNIKRQIKDKRKPLSRKEQADLLESLENEDITGKTVVIRIALSTGFRRGECLGLKWGDIDLKNRVINLTRQLTSKGEFDTPKYGGIGIIAIDESLTRYLQLWKRETSKKHYGGKAVPNDSPVCRNDNGSQLQPANFDKWRREWFVKHGLGHYTEIREVWDSKGRKRYHKTGYKGYRLHELRHTMATEVTANSDIKTAQTIMRHTNINTTAGYVHEIDENVRNAVERLAAMRENSDVGGEELQQKKDEKRLRGANFRKEKHKAYKRQHGKCNKCGKKFEESDLVMSAIEPLKSGGTRTVSNMELICQKCNLTEAGL